MEKDENLLNVNYETINQYNDNDITVASKKELYSSNLFGHKSSEVIDKFITHYEKRNSHNRHLRIWFFSISFFLILLVVATFTAFTVILAIHGNINVEAAVSICGVCATVLTTLIVLPKMVGKNLFPETEDKEIMNFVKEMNLTELEFEKIKLFMQNYKLNDKNTDNT